MLVDRLSQRWFISAYPFTRFKILVLDLRLNPWIQIQLGFNSPLVVFGGLFLKDAKSVLKDWLFTYHSFILSFFFFFLHLYFFGLKIFVVMFSPYFQPYPLLFQTCLFLCSECRDQMNLFSCSDEMVVLFHTHTCLCVYDVTLIQFCCLMDIYRFLCECVTSTKFPPELSDMISFLPFFFQNIRNFFSVLYAHTW